MSVFRTLILAVVFALPLPLHAEGEEVAGARGEVTNLPLPRFVSLKAEQANARRGPSTGHRIDWVFTRQGIPLQIVDEYGHWRRVLDRDGLGGWVHYTLLSGLRTVMITEDLTALRTLPETKAPEVARLETGVVAEVLACDIDWCRLEADGYRGWAEKTRFWGVGPSELID